MIAKKTTKLSKNKRTEISLQRDDMLKGRSTIEKPLKYRKSYRNTGVSKHIDLSNGKKIRSIVHGVKSIKNSGIQAHKNKLQQEAKVTDEKFRRLLKAEIKKIVSLCYDDWNTKDKKYRISSRTKKKLYNNDIQNYINTKLCEAGLDKF